MTDTVPRSPDPAAPSRRRLALPEFVALLAVLFATVAFAIDAMLPALPTIAAELAPEAANRAQLVLTAFVAGMGAGTLVAGPLADAIGRRPTIVAGFALYALAAVAAIFAGSLTALLVARFVQGIGAAGPRIAGTAMVRDLYEGRQMARITSLVMMIFILVPAIAPLLGAQIIAVAGWRGVFAAFVVFAAIGSAWLLTRQPETLDPAARRPLRAADLIAGLREVLADRQVMLATVVLTLGFGQMFALLSSAQQLFADVYGRGDSFPLWFAAMALLSGTGTVLNAVFVVRFGMRRIARAAYAMQVLVSAVMLGWLAATGGLPFAAFFVWAVSVFFMAGVTFGNLNALAMQHMGHRAGMTASVVAAISTVAATVIAAPVGLLFDGTPLPAVAATLICSVAAWALMARLRD